MGAGEVEVELTFDRGIAGIIGLCGSRECPGKGLSDFRVGFLPSLLDRSALSGVMFGKGIGEALRKEVDGFLVTGCLSEVNGLTTPCGVFSIGLNGSVSSLSLDLVRGDRLRLLNVRCRGQKVSASLSVGRLDALVPAREPLKMDALCCLVSGRYTCDIVAGSFVIGLLGMNL